MSVFVVANIVTLRRGRPLPNHLPIEGILNYCQLATTIRAFILSLRQLLITSFLNTNIANDIFQERFKFIKYGQIVGAV